MLYSYKIATLNINGLATQPRIMMLEDFLHKQQIDILFLQEVTRPVFDYIQGYVAHTNIGTTGRGTAILTRVHIQLMNIVRLPTGSGIAAVFQNVTLVKIYAPSGVERRREREQFFFKRLTLSIARHTLSIARHPNVPFGGRRLQHRPDECGRLGTSKLQWGAARANAWLRPSGYVGDIPRTCRLYTLYKSRGFAD
jgi:hypothetical protein